MSLREKRSPAWPGSCAMAVNVSSRTAKWERASGTCVTGTWASSAQIRGMVHRNASAVSAPAAEAEVAQ